MMQLLRSLWLFVVTKVNNLKSFLLYLIIVSRLKRLVRLRVYFSVSVVPGLYKCNAEFFLGRERLFSYGVSKSYQESFLKTISELFERYIPWSVSVHGALPDELTKERVSFLGEIHTSLRVVPVYCLATKVGAYVPAHCVRRYAPTLDGAQVLFPFTTNGSAAHVVEDDALCNGIYEAIERDALLCHWYGKVAPSRITTEHMPRSLRDIVSAYNFHGITIDVLLITTDIHIPAVCVVASTVIDGEIRRCYTAAAHLSLERAIKKALHEVTIIQSHLFAPHSKEINLEHIQQHERPRLWRGSAFEKEFSWFLSGEERDYPATLALFERGTIQGSPDTLALYLKEKGVTTYAYIYPAVPRISSRVIVCKIVTPELFPFFLSEQHKKFGTKRLANFCMYKKIPFFEYTYPHLLP